MLAVDIIFIMNTTLDSAGITQEEVRKLENKAEDRARENTTIKKGIQKE